MSWPAEREAVAWMNERPGMAQHAERYRMWAQLNFMSGVVQSPHTNIELTS